MVTTDNFTFSAIGNEVPGQQHVRKQMDYIPESSNFIADAEVFNNYIYVEDTNTGLRSGNEIGTSFELHSFPSIPMTNAVPPDHYGSWTI